MSIKPKVLFHERTPLVNFYQYMPCRLFFKDYLIGFLSTKKSAAPSSPMADLSPLDSTTRIGIHGSKVRDQ
jgi:hypothetical protein